MGTARISTIIRLRPDVMSLAKRRAKQDKLSLNAFIEQVLERECRVEWPVLPPDFKISQKILNMRCIPAGWRPSKEELESDPRLAHIIEECGYEA